MPSLLSWERGLKSKGRGWNVFSKPVAPLVGAWIEITIYNLVGWRFGSLLSWERGLKFVDGVGGVGGVGRSSRGSVD